MQRLVTNLQSIFRMGGVRGVLTEVRKAHFITQKWKEKHPRNFFAYVLFSNPNAVESGDHHPPFVLMLLKTDC